MAISEELITTLETPKQLTPEQQSAVNAPLPTVTLACPGTGKTFTMIERIVKAHQSDGIPLDNMFVATFSKYAANEMTKRLLDKLPATPQFIGTFHRNCIRLYKAFPQLMTRHGYRVNRIGFATAAECEEIIVNELNEYKEDIKNLGLKIRNVKKMFKTTIDSLKALGIYPIDYHGYTAPKDLDVALRELIKKTLKGVGETLEQEGLESPPEDIFWEFYIRYQETLKQTNMLDYNDVIALPVFAMRDIRLQKIVASRFKLVVIDEFQDCSTMQFELIAQLSNNYQTAFLVGDEDQLLYEWRDANLEKVMSFYQNQDFNIRVLQGNFRSQKPIIDLVIPIITQNKKRYQTKVMKPIREVSTPNSVYFIQPYDDKHEAFIIARKIKEMLDGEDPDFKDIKASDIAIIFSSKFYCNHIEAALKKENIDYNFVKGYGFFESPEVFKVLNYLSLALDHDNNKAFLRVINYPQRGNGISHSAKIQTTAKQKNASFFDTLVSEPRFLNYKDNRNFVTTIEDLGRLMKEKKTPLKVFGLLMERINLEEALVKEHGELEAKGRYAKVEQLQQLVGELLKEYNSYKEVIEHLWSDIFSTSKETIEDKVQLMTAFGAKGLEFKIVYIIGAVNGNFPSYNEGSTAEAGRRIFYVACTRAKDFLVISAPRFLHRTGTLVECMPTMFLEGLGESYEAVQESELLEFGDYLETHELEEPSGRMFVGTLPKGFES